ncbi:hypothetical protein [Microbispora sp. NPDC049125]|uniref:hypothetical protein n=1 Tax=Microbispora sp. NPDC049125 TaxID=3154929 RepID=UPI003465DFC8
MPERYGALVLMGSGETSPTMVEVHRGVVRRLGNAPRAILLDTPYAFQENAADISARARRYFAGSVGLDVVAAEEIGTADWVFSGPGSPTYALGRWTATAVGADLRARVRARDGATVLASAAACTAGVATVPVYEIYKAGAEPHWREGLDLLGALGLRVAVIPHYDNAEGGTHDTRYCYLGERRLARMERELPQDAAVLGIDEHTAVLIDLSSEGVEVLGRGGLTVRRPGEQTFMGAGSTTTLAELRGLVAGERPAPGTTAPSPAPGQATPEPVTPEPVTLDPVTLGPVTLGEVTRTCVARFDAALAEHDQAAATQAVLDLEAEIVKWSADLEEDEGGVGQAREALRHLIVRLGRLADTRDPRDRIAPLVEPLLALRGRLRDQGAFDTADAVRAALTAGGVSVSDVPGGHRWTCPPAHR